MNANFSSLASQPVRVGYAVRVAFCILAAGVALCVGKTLLAKSLSMSAMAAPMVARQAISPAAQEPAKDVCRQVTVELDEGYGLRGHATRWVCRKAL
jgi:hypothetical protein